MAECGNLDLNHASPANFELVFPKLPAQTDFSASTDLTLNIHTVVIPGVSMEMREDFFQAGKTPRAMGPLIYEPWSVTFMVDEDFTNWKILWDWMAYINNNKDKMAELPENYTVEATLRVLDNFQQDIFNLFFIGVWISNLSEVNFTYREPESVLECVASFNYDRYEYRSSS